MLGAEDLFNTVNPFEVDIFKLARQSLSVYPEHYPVNGTVPPGGQASPVPKAHIANTIVFWCVGMHGRFQTQSGGADVGVSQINLKITDTGRQLNLTKDFISADLLFSPGRVRTPGIAGDPSNQLFYPGFINHVFMPESDIEVEMASDAAADTNICQIDFFGFNYQVPAGALSELIDKGLVTRTENNPYGIYGR